MRLATVSTVTSCKGMWIRAVRWSASIPATAVGMLYFTYDPSNGHPTVPKGSRSERCQPDRGRIRIRSFSVTIIPYTRETHQLPPT